jgi:hypothetical protein
MNQAIPFYHEAISDQESAFTLVKYAREQVAGIRLDVQGADKQGRFILDGGKKAWLLPEKDPLLPIKPAPRKTTAQQYMAASIRIAARDLEPKDIVDMAHTKRTFYYYRAAMVWFSARESLRCVRHADQIAKREGCGPQYFEVINDLREWVKVLDVFKPDPEHGRRQQGQKTEPGVWTQAQNLALQARKPARGKTEQESTVVPKRPLKQTGKRKGLSSLPDTWQEQYWSWVKDSKYADAIAVLDCCGCRPSELELGVDVTYRDGYLELYIQGTKRHGGKYGQAWRRVKVEPTFPAALHLVKLCSESYSGTANVRVESGKNLSATMAWYSKALWPDQRYVVTPYSYRHQFRVEAVDKLTTDEVAQAMGHSVDRTQNHYGTSRQARGRQGGLKVEASRMPKHTRGVAPGYGGTTGPGL